MKKERIYTLFETLSDEHLKTTTPHIHTIGDVKGFHLHAPLHERIIQQPFQI